MGFSNDDLSRLQKAIASGIKSVTFSDGRVTTYQSVSDMVAALKYVKDQIAIQNGVKKDFVFISGMQRR
nr:hypothetical protein [uncultured Cohaesibacter sp.]